MMTTASNEQMDTTPMTNSPSGECERAQPSHLYNHALESIFAWLSLVELARVMATCKRWHHIVGTTMKRTEGHARVRFMFGRYGHSIPLRLARHVAHVTTHAFCSVTAAFLFDTFPYLESFVGKLDITADDVVGLQFRPALTLVDITLPGPFRMLATQLPSTPRMNYVLQALSTLPYLRSIKLHLGCMDNSFSVGALRDMRQLESLTISIASRPYEFSLKFLDELRALTWLKSVRVWYLSESEAVLAYLFRSPCELKWERFSPDSHSQRYILDALLALPKLTFARFNNVRNSDWGDSDTDTTIQSSLLAERLCVMPKLSSLHLQVSWMRSVDMHRIMSTCRLQTVDLEVISDWNSFDCFLSGPITHTLRSLRISRCDDIPSSEISKLTALTSLRALSIIEMWSDADVNGLRIPSAILPRLETFTYFEGPT